MPRCVACGSNFTSTSKEQYRNAPAWKNECPSCTKKKFSSYITGYLLQLLSKADLVASIGDYFGSVEGLPVASDPDGTLATKTLQLVLDVPPASSPSRPPTPGHAIRDFVKHFDGLVKPVERLAVDRRSKVIILVVAGIGIGLVVLPFLLTFL